MQDPAAGQISTLKSRADFSTLEDVYIRICLRLGDPLLDNLIHSSRPKRPAAGTAAADGVNFCSHLPANARTSQKQKRAHGPKSFYGNNFRRRIFSNGPSCIASDCQITAYGGKLRAERTGSKLVYTRGICFASHCLKTVCIMKSPPNCSRLPPKNRVTIHNVLHKNNLRQRKTPGMASSAALARGTWNDRSGCCKTRCTALQSRREIFASSWWPGKKKQRTPPPAVPASANEDARNTNVRDSTT